MIWACNFASPAAVTTLTLLGLPQTRIHHATPGIQERLISRNMLVKDDGVPRTA